MKQFDERLRSYYPKLSPHGKRIADFMFDHLDDLISYNSVELAKLSGVSKATVSRLFKRLGYEKYKDMRNELRTLRQSGMPLTDNRAAVQGNTLLSRHYKHEIANLTQWVNNTNPQQFNEVIQSFVQAKRIFIIGMRNAYPVALHLRQQLIQARSQVYLLPYPGQTLGEELVDITPNDTVVVMAFRRRARIICPLLKLLQKSNIPVLALCEPQAQDIMTLARWQMCTPLDSVSAFDNYSSTMSLINLLANALLHEILSDGRQRIHQIAHFYQHLDELENR